MDIMNGLCHNVDSCNFIIDLIPLDRRKSLKLGAMQTKGITIHNFGSDHIAKNVTEYVDNTTNIVAWHFTIGEGIVYQELPINIYGLHAGDGRYGFGNQYTIGIEIQETKTSIVTATKFIAELLKALNMTTHEVDTHKSRSGKNCPRMILPIWDSFIKDINDNMKPEHWANKHYLSLLEKGYKISEQRYDDKITRGELFALLDKKE